MPDPPTIEFCTRNVDMASYHRLRRFAGEVEQQHCLGRCGPCREGPFLMIDGRFIRGEHHDLLGSLPDSGKDSGP